VINYFLTSFGFTKLFFFTKKYDTGGSHKVPIGFLLKTFSKVFYRCRFDDLKNLWKIIATNFIAYLLTICTKLININSTLRKCIFLFLSPFLFSIPAILSAVFLEHEIQWHPLRSRHRCGFAFHFVMKKLLKIYLANLQHF
jgi:hypothetical protein